MDIYEKYGGDGAPQKNDARPTGETPHPTLPAPCPVRTFLEQQHRLNPMESIRAEGTALKTILESGLTPLERSTLRDAKLREDEEKARLEGADAQFPAMNSYWRAEGERRAAHEADVKILADAERRLQDLAVEPPTSDVEQVPAPAKITKAKPSPYKQACPEWLRKVWRTSHFQEAVRLGDEAEGVPLVPGVDYSASAVVKALKDLKLIPFERDDKTMGAAIRELYSDVKWDSREKGAKAAAILVKCFRRGTEILQRPANQEATKARQGIKRL